MNSANTATARATEKVLGAFLGAAVGDALGWPNEMPARRVRSGKGDDAGLVASFEAWRRRSGGRFMPHEETIRAGEYSDDTQLLLCSARSLLHGGAWFDHLVFKELPTWRLYQRGGGGATNRAVDLWIKGQRPWSLNPDDPNWRSYFDAGGNGVAMRILPHPITAARDNSFRSTVQAILLNGISTHGHPRALLGALAYGFVVWHALRMTGTLAYGQLIELVLNHSDDWSVFPERVAMLSEWREKAERAYQVPFDRLWSKTELEMRQLLEKSLMGIKAGAISIDSKVLDDLGCFDRSINGAGTVCAAAAIYIASKYAPDPNNGVLEAASSKGADTDTLASMSGGLLGAIAGVEWLQRYRNQLQDERYITTLAQRLANDEFDQTLVPKITTSVKPSLAVSRFLEELPDKPSDIIFELPDGRKAFVKEVLRLESKSDNLQGRQWMLKTEDGQSLYIKKLERPPRVEGTKSTPRTPDAKVDAKKKTTRSKMKVKAVKLIVQSLERSRWFYHEVLGLKVDRESKTLVNFGGLISLVSREHETEFGDPEREGFNTKSILCMECPNIEAAHDRVRSFIDVKASGIQERAGRKVFRCFDLDGNLIEIFQAVPSKAPTEPTPTES